MRILMFICCSILIAGCSFQGSEDELKELNIGVPAVGNIRVAMVIFQNEDIELFRVKTQGRECNLIDLLKAEEDFTEFEPEKEEIAIEENGNFYCKVSLIENPKGYKEDSMNFPSLRGIGKLFFERESKRLLGKGIVSLNIKVFGPYKIKGLPFIEEGSSRDSQELARKNRVYLQAVFEKEYEGGIFDIINIIYIDDWSNLADNGFVSQAFRMERATFVEWTNWTAIYHMEMQTLVHEMMHVFGGNDHWEGFKNTDNSYIPENLLRIMGGMQRLPAKYFAFFQFWEKEGERLTSDGRGISQEHLLLNYGISEKTAEEIGWRDINENDILDVKEL